MLETGGYFIGAYSQLQEALQATADFVLARDDGRFAVNKLVTAASSSFFAAAGFGRAAGSAKSALGIGRELVGGPLILFKLGRRSENE